MSSLAKDIDLLDAHIGLFNYRNLRHTDWLLLCLVLALAGAGLLTLYNASADYVKQAIWLCVGTVVALVILCIDYRFLVSMAPFMYTVAVILLAAVLVVGVAAHGGQHWLQVGPLRFQPSEVSKVALIYMLAWYLSTIQRRVRKFRYVLGTFLITGLLCVLVLLQGDLGTMTALVPVPFVMLYVAGCRWWHLLLILVAGLAVSPFGWMHIKPYQKARLLTFIQPEPHPEHPLYEPILAAGYQPLQAKIAIGSGGMTGKGFGEDTMAALDFIPEYHNDFVFALLAEGRGFIGGVAVIALFAALLLRGLALARGCSEISSTLLVAGAVTVLGFHAFVNMAITLGLMPVTGLPLPFFSYGGSFYLTTLLCVGTILSANVKRGIFDK
jgi:rod shape determining protein RodA